MFAQDFGFVITFELTQNADSSRGSIGASRGITDGWVPGSKRTRACTTTQSGATSPLREGRSGPQPSAPTLPAKRARCAGEVRSSRSNAPPTIPRVASSRSVAPLSSRPRTGSPSSTSHHPAAEVARSVSTSRRAGIAAEQPRRDATSAPAALAKRRARSRSHPASSE